MRELTVLIFVLVFGKRKLFLWPTFRCFWPIRWAFQDSWLLQVIWQDCKQNTQVVRHFIVWHCGNIQYLNFEPVVIAQNDKFKCCFHWLYSRFKTWPRNAIVLNLKSKPTYTVRQFNALFSNILYVLHKKNEACTWREISVLWWTLQEIVLQSMNWAGDSQDCWIMNHRLDAPQFQKQTVVYLTVKRRLLFLLLFFFLHSHFEMEFFSCIPDVVYAYRMFHECLQTKKKNKTTQIRVNAWNFVHINPLGQKRHLPPYLKNLTGIRDRSRADFCRSWSDGWSFPGSCSLQPPQHPMSLLVLLVSSVESAPA